MINYKVFKTIRGFQILILLYLWILIDTYGLYYAYDT